MEKNYCNPSIFKALGVISNISYYPFLDIQILFLFHTSDYKYIFDFSLICVSILFIKKLPSKKHLNFPMEKNCRNPSIFKALAGVSILAYEEEKESCQR